MLNAQEVYKRELAESAVSVGSIEWPHPMLAEAARAHGIICPDCGSELVRVYACYGNGWGYEMECRKCGSHFDLSDQVEEYLSLYENQLQSKAPPNSVRQKLFGECPHCERECFANSEGVCLVCGGELLYKNCKLCGYKLTAEDQKWDGFCINHYDQHWGMVTARSSSKSDD